MTCEELIEELKKYPADAKINIHVDGETSELILDNAYGDVDVEGTLLLTMQISNIDFLYKPDYR